MSGKSLPVSPTQAQWASFPCWMQDEYEKYLAAWGCMPNRLYAIKGADGKIECLYAGSDRSDCPDLKIWPQLDTDTISRMVLSEDGDFLTYNSGVAGARDVTFRVYRGLTYALANEDYRLPLVPDDCGALTNVAVVSEGGFDRLVKTTSAPLPQGYQEITRAIPGSFVHTFTLTNTDPTYRGDPATPDGSSNWAELFRDLDLMPDEYIGKLVFPAADFCSLRTAGQKVQVRLDATIGYYLDTAIKDLLTIAPYQWGTALRVNGDVIARNGDMYGLNTSGFNSSVSDILSGVWTTDGTDMCVEVLFILFSASSGAGTPGRAGDTMHIDMAKAGVTITPIS